MSLTAKTYGLIPAFHPSGQSRANRYNILNNAGTGYATAIYKGQLVEIDTGNNGTIEASDGTSDCLGVFAGCEYIDPTGKPVSSPYWPASTQVLAGSQIVAYVYDDPATVYKTCVTANASGFVQAAIGDQVDISFAAGGNTSTGLSNGSVIVAMVGNGATAVLRILGFVDNEIYNATTNPFPELLVQINQLQFAPNAAVE
jgi:hypothetical protein